MAIPLNYDPNQSLYMVRISMGSPYLGVGRDLTEYKREFTFKKSKNERREIQAIRQVINTRRSFSCTKFFGAYFTNQIGKDQLIEACIKADQEMKRIDPALHVTPVFMKIDLPDLASGSQFDALLSAIRTQVIEVVLNRVKAQIEKGDLTPKSKNNLLKMLDKASGLNIVNDPGIKNDIENIRARINADQLIELKNELLSILEKENKDRGSALEIVVDQPIPVDDDESEDQITRSAKTPVSFDRELDLV